MSNKIWYFIFLINFSICSAIYLWRIEKKPPSYIFGTMHIPYKLVWPYVSNETREAFLSSTHFYGEIDAKNDAYWDDFLECIVKKSTRTRRSKKSKYKGDLLDVHLAVQARQMNKNIGSLESPQYHCEKLSSLYNLTMWKKIIHSVKSKMINGSFTVKNIEKLLEKAKIKKYNCEEITGKYLENLYDLEAPELHLNERDEQMSRYIHRLLQYSKTNRYFFAIGAAHMLRKNENIIVRLKKFGYNVTRICTNRKRALKKLGCKKKKTAKHCLKT